MPQPKPAPSADAVLAALRTSRARLVETAASLTAEQLREPSYDSEWSIAQVLSHIGTGAIFFRLILEAGLAGEPAPGTDVMQPIWAEWNAKSPDEQARDGLEADVELIDAVAALDTYQRDDWHIDLFGTERDFTGFLRMRLSEHAVHTWDIAVALDAKAQLPPDSVDVLIDTLGPLAALVGKPLDHQLVLGVETDESRPQLRADCRRRRSHAQAARCAMGSRPAAGVASGGLHPIDLRSSRSRTCATRR